MYIFVIVGVGGTGSLVARDLPKLILETKSRMLIIDGDVVEKGNMKRQAYQEHDVGENKAIALSRKINTFYGNICEAVDGYVTGSEIQELLKRKYERYIPVLIGCVDNNKTRILLEECFEKLSMLFPSCFYIDSANSEFDGNVYVAYKKDDQIRGKLRSQTYEFDMDQHPAEKSCEQQIAAGNMQFMVTNLKMAMAVIEHVYAIMTDDAKEGVTVVHRFEEVHIDPQV